MAAVFKVPTTTRRTALPTAFMPWGTPGGIRVASGDYFAKQALHPFPSFLRPVAKPVTPALKPPVAIAPIAPIVPSLNTVATSVPATPLTMDSKAAASAPSLVNSTPMSAPAAADTVIPGPEDTTDATSTGFGGVSPVVLVGAAVLAFLILSRNR